MKSKDLLTILIVLLLVNFLFSFFTGKQTTNDQTTTNSFIISSAHNEYALHDQISVKIKNNTSQAGVIKNTCPNPPLTVSTQVNNQWVDKTSVAHVDCKDTTDLTINPGEEKTIAFQSWNNALFGEKGKYKIKAVINTKAAVLNTPTVQQTQAAVISTTQQTTQTQADTQTVTQATTQNVVANQTQQSATLQDTIVTVETSEFEVKDQNWFNWLWTTIFYQPIYNILIFLASILPAHSLGLAIILLTIIIRTILLIPSQKALKSQRMMTELQPKINKIKEKHGENQEAIARETMELWKQHRVNPASSCLPLLIQFPVLIALYSVVQNGLNPDAAYLLYEPLKYFSVTLINPNFLSLLDLTQVNTIVLPLIVGGLQFLQMQLTFAKSKKKEQTNKPEKKQVPNEMDAANKMMGYIMPITIAIFTATTPAGIGLYWGTSTLYSIIQQLVVNKQVASIHDKKNDDGVKVKVIK